MTMDQKWLRHVLSQHHESAYRWSCQCCHYDDELAKDVLQQTYLKIMEGKATFDQRSQLITWLFSIIRFTAYDELKKRDRVNYTSLELIEGHAEFNVNDRLDFRKELERLSEKQKEVMLLVFYHEMTIEAAAEVMNCSLGTARTHYQRGKEQLKKLLENERG